MSNRPYRSFNQARDIKAVQQIWIDCGWIDDNDDERKMVADFFSCGEAEIATINDEAECSVHWTPGSIVYQEETLSLGAVTAVTTSHVGRKQGFARELTARSLARQFSAGCEISALGMFDQGFYDKVGFGSGPYETLVQFDPATLNVSGTARPPRRLTIDDYAQMHQAMVQRKKFHGAVDLDPPEILKVELQWTDKPFGLGYFDGPGGSLSHFIWGDKKDEHGPYEVTARAYQNTEQLLELLALIKSLGDQVSSFGMLEFGEFQLQDLLTQPFRTRRASRGGKHEQILQAVSYWQIRMLNLEACLAKTHLTGPGVRFNLNLTDPLDEILGGLTPWTGLTGHYVVDLGEQSSAHKGTEKHLPTLTASVNAFSRLWFGVRPASNLMITDDLQGDESLITAIDKAVSLPRPHFGWDF